ncbi:MAG: DUF2842 domain-containing protein [Hyphomicrobium sp.]|nr:DUF2842 domain-containing protein [Hyphomicrobium sp.]
MQPRTRKLVGTILLLVLIAVYALSMMVLATTLEVHQVKGVEFLFHVIAGLGWVPLAMPIIWWMQKKS